MTFDDRAAGHRDHGAVAAVRPRRGRSDRSRRQGAAGRARRLRCARAARVDRLRPAAQGRRGRCAAAAGARREAAAAIGSAAGARDSQRPLLAAGRAPTTSRCSSTITRPIGPLPLSLQIGRNGPPLQTWTLQPQPGELWHTTLWLPVDASFVGLRGAGRARARDRRDHHHAQGRRRRRRAAAGAGRARGRELSGRDAVTFTTSSSIRKRKASGRWAGRRRRSPSRRPPGQTAPVMLRMHPGAKANRRDRQHVRVAAHIRSGARQAAEVELPQFPSGVVPLTISAETGFYPRDIDPEIDRSAVPRRLGRGQGDYPTSAETLRAWVNHEPAHRSPPRIRQPRARRSRMRMPIRSSNSRSGSTKR